MVILFFHFFFLIQHILFFLGPLYPINGIASSQSDDGSSPQISLNRPFVFFGQTYNQIYVNHNGHLTFDAAWSSFSPQMFPMHGSRDIIAPLWVDLDNRENGQVYYNQYNSASVLQQVAYYPTTGTRTTVQAVLISGGQYSFVLMNYGVIAATSRHIQAGYDTVHSAHHFSIPGSFSSNSSGPDSNFRLSSNVNVAGRWAFRVDRGSTAWKVPGNYTCSDGCGSSYDGSSPRITLLRPFVYFGQTYNYIYVNQNGHLTFNAAWNSYTPQRFPMHGPRDFIAPFWTDLDNRGNGHVYYNQYTTGSVLQQATQDINTHFPGLNFNANWVFVATWYEVAYYPNSGTVSQHSVTDLLQKHIS
uniref:NIDO domain-containing protein n=1 Tax=Lates calcarifer TaxID=8187 RepID=A0A4W6DY46_LATCA